MYLHALTHIYYIYEEKKYELDAHLEQIADGDAQWYYKPREIDFTEDILVGGKGAAALVETVGKIVPTEQTCHIEQWLRKAISRYASDTTEYNHEHDGGNEWLNDKPKRTEDSLFVKRHDVTLDVHADKVAITPQFLEVNVPETGMCFDD